MSARFFKIFSGVFLAHLVVLNVVWVGFSAPFPRPPATFTYEGALPAEDTTGKGRGCMATRVKRQINLRLIILKHLILIIGSRSGIHQNLSLMIIWDFNVIVALE